MIVVSGKQAPRGYPYEGEKSDLYPTDLSDTEGTPPSHSSPPPDYASGSHLGVDLPSSPSGGTEAPLDSKGAFKPETTTDNQLESSSKQKKVQFWHTTKVHFYEPDPPLAPEDRPPPTTKVQWGHTTKVHFFEPDEPGILPPPPGRDGYLVKVATQKSPSSEIELASPSSYFEPPPPPPPSNGFVSKFKTFFGKLGKLNFRPRFQRTEREYQPLPAGCGRDLNVAQQGRASPKRTEIKRSMKRGKGSALNQKAIHTMTRRLGQVFYRSGRGAAR